jgi:hypothetical protein
MKNTGSHCAEKHKNEGWLFLLKRKFASNVLHGMMILSVLMTKAGLAAEFPSLGDSRNKVEKHYGLPAVAIAVAEGRRTITLQQKMFCNIELFRKS